ncbi:thioesterase domain-containing protein [Myxococcus sp. MxC21-1]|uniref:thioesterase II family protein n=1 Tax=Myxococcus sp. MxC21-1 TaxID=3041439 RepID=UPI00292CB653|nr:thioesterase domain-containing protein [Myxococcus sp. MxC21-1]WNZ65578.1 thioesterase domain-containing protein [Myxococcus sp. MxC21-1]
MTDWLAFHVPAPASWARLFCLPHAGGSASLFRTASGAGTGHRGVPGAAPRPGEPPSRAAPARAAGRHRPLVDVLAKHTDKPYALFGHSMGALLAYELTRALRERGLPAPLHLFVASYRAPHTLQAHAPATATHDIDASEARRLGESRAVSGEMAEELLTLMRTTMLADTAVCEGYSWKPGPVLACPLSAFRGFDDYVPDDATEAWRQLTSGPFATQTFLGDHFFLRQTPRGLLQNIRRSLTRLRPASTR